MFLDWKITLKDISSSVAHNFPCELYHSKLYYTIKWANWYFHINSLPPPPFPPTSPKKLSTKLLQVLMQKHWVLKVELHFHLNIFTKKPKKHDQKPCTSPTFLSNSFDIFVTSLSWISCKSANSLTEMSVFWRSLCCFIWEVRIATASRSISTCLCTELTGHSL